MSKKVLVLFLFSLFLKIDGNLLAQNVSIKDNSYYFDDKGGISDGRCLNKIIVLTIVNGDIPIFYEKVLGKSFCIEVVAGLLLPYHTFELADILFEDIKNVEPSFGYSLWLQPKYYIQHMAPEHNYLGLQYRRKNYVFDNETTVYTDKSLNFGLQFSYRKKMIFDYCIGFGSRNKNRKFKNTNAASAGFIMPLEIKLSNIL